MSHPFRLLVFDYDGTLVDSQGSITQAMETAFREHGLPAPDAGAVRRVVGLKLEPAVARLLPDDAAWETITSLVDGYRRAFGDMRRRADYHEPLFPGAREAIERLDEPEVCLGIATGKSRRGLVDGLERHGLRHHFITLQTADDGPGKPHPELMHRAMREAGAEPEETVLIGDTTFDMQMAVNAGALAVGVGWGYHDADELRASGAACVIDDFAALSAGLSALGAEVA